MSCPVKNLVESCIVTHTRPYIFFEMTTVADRCGLYVVLRIGHIGYRRFIIITLVMIIIVAVVTVSINLFLYLVVQQI